MQRARKKALIPLCMMSTRGRGHSDPEDSRGEDPSGSTVGSAAWFAFHAASYSITLAVSRLAVSPPQLRDEVKAQVNGERHPASSHHFAAIDDPGFDRGDSFVGRAQEIKRRGLVADPHAARSGLKAIENPGGSKDKGTGADGRRDRARFPSPQELEHRLALSLLLPAGPTAHHERCEGGQPAKS